MDGYWDKENRGITELRVHGVSGTPPESMLENPHVRLVSGDSTAGFYRRLWLGGKPSGNSFYADVPNEPGRPGRRREAYSWGGLTSGAGSRALWMLLLPFMLANVAFWMYPAAKLPGEDHPGSRGSLRSATRDLASALQRLFSLSLTLALTASAVGVATDLVGWQCAGSQACLSHHGFLRFLALAFFRQPSRRLAVASVVPVAVVALLWWLGKKSWNAYERLQPAPLPDDDVPLVPAIGRRRLWNGGEPVRRSRSLHVCAAFATVGLFLVAPLASGSHRLGGLVTALVVLFLLALGGPVIALLVPPLWRRSEPERNESSTGGPDDPGHRQLHPDPRDLWQKLPWIALALVAIGIAVAFVGGVGPARSAGSLPWLTGFLGWMFLAQMGLLALAGIVVAVAAARSRGRRVPARRANTGLAGHTPPDGPAPLPGRALAGMGTPVMLLLSWALAASLAAGLVLRWAGFLGTPAPAGMPPASQSALLVPAPYYWAAAGALCLAAVTVLLLAGVSWRVWRRAAVLARRMTGDTYASEQLNSPAACSAEVTERAKEITRSWALARLTDSAQMVLAIMAVVLLAATAVGLAGYLVTTVIDGRAVRGMWLWQHASWLATAGSWATGAFVVTLIGLGNRAYSDPATRRTVGILWDLGTFWPRATHPLAPPCYCERTLPELIDRMAWLAPTDDDLVVLSTHSQGTVIGGALILQLGTTQRARTAFITYGSPLQRLYRRFFPAYFGTEVLGDIGRALAGTQAAITGDREDWPWRNLFRASDPIGGAIFVECLADETIYQPSVIDAMPADALANEDNTDGDRNDVDRQFLDPVFNRAQGNMAYPPTLRHSGYFEDPYFQACVDRVITLARQRSSATHPQLRA